MATVYLARLSGVGGFQRFVAIKRLHPHLAREPEFIEMFLEEARLAARIHHPNVVPILEIGTSEQGYYIVMEYVEGDTLGRLLARSAQTGVRLPTKVGLRVVIDMLAGLDAAHELKDDDDHPLGIVHRDVSPQNVLVGVDGSARLSDFGVARATSRLSTTRSGQLKGKLAYMAPEQARGDRDIDRRADLFASGIVLWEVLACRRLFKGEGEADTLNRVLYEPIPTPRQANPDVPEALEAVVMKALDRDPAKRWETASDFADALEKVAREHDRLGTHKDVAAHLQSVLGTDISAQRDAVRSWLARSEPSQRFSGQLPLGPISAPSMPSTKPDGVAPPGVSSVSSAVIQVGSSPSHTPAPPLVAMELPERRRSRAWIGAAAAGVLLVVGAVAFVSTRGTKTDSPKDTTATQPPPPASTATPAVAAVTTTTPTQPQPSATQAEPEPAATHAAMQTTHTSKPNGHGAVKPQPTTTAAVATATATATAPTPPPTNTVDDISKNPYR